VTGATPSLVKAINGYCSIPERLNEEYHTLILGLLTVGLFFVVRYLVQVLFLGPLARYFNIKSKTGVYKFQETGWYGLYYTSFFFFGCYVLYLESFAFEHGPVSISSEWSLRHTENYYKGWPLHPFPTIFKTYYLMELSFYLHCVFARLFERRQKDFYEMTLHHIVTFTLVAVSYFFRYQRVGLVILILHNASDIFLYCGKCFHYIVQRVPPKTSLAKNLDLFTNFLFLLFTITFFVTRLIFFPFYVVRSTIFELPVIIPSRGYYIVVSQVFLCVLVGLHIFWFGLITRMLLRVVQNKEFADIRSDTDEEDNSKEPKDQAEPIPPPKNSKSETGSNGHAKKPSKADKKQK